MTEDQKLEISMLATEARRLQTILDCHLATNIPADPIKAEESRAALEIARAEWLEAEVRLHVAQGRILSAIR